MDFVGASGKLKIAANGKIITKAPDNQWNKPRYGTGPNRNVGVKLKIEPTTWTLVVMVGLQVVLLWAVQLDSNIRIFPNPKTFQLHLGM